jgi:hypothetical protein
MIKKKMRMSRILMRRMKSGRMRLMIKIIRKMMTIVTNNNYKSIKVLKIVLFQAK